MTKPTKQDGGAVHSNGGTISVTMVVNRQARTIVVEPRTTLLQELRNELMLTGTKMGCDRGEAGACTVHVDGRRDLSCMTLAAMQDCKGISTINRLEDHDTLHPVL